MSYLARWILSLVLAAASFAMASHAAAFTLSLSSLQNIEFELHDLDPSDGIAPGWAFSPPYYHSPGAVPTELLIATAHGDEFTQWFAEFIALTPQTSLTISGSAVVWLKSDEYGKGLFGLIRLIAQGRIRPGDLDIEEFQDRIMVDDIYTEGNTPTVDVLVARDMSITIVNATTDWKDYAVYMDLMAKAWTTGAVAVSAPSTLASVLLGLFLSVGVSRAHSRRTSREKRG